MSQTDRALLDEAEAWVVREHPGQAEHLVRARYWLNQFAPNASLAVKLATVTHDMERAFPGEDAPDMARMVVPTDTQYCLAHGRRSARFVTAWLNEQGADEQLVFMVSELIVVHEYGGWPDADLVQAADSLSFLEVNTEKFLAWIPTAEHGWGYERTKIKFDWMYQRITVPLARELAQPLYERAIGRILAAKVQGV